MELFIFIICVAILVETTATLFINNKKISVGAKARRKVYVDTSALIDGRFLSVAQTGFIGDDIIIPRSVIRELQLLADGKDSEKRTKARAGMDVVNELERVVYFNVEILQDELDHTPVDERLIELAKKNHGMILTCDFNLEKVANTENIDVLNVNNLALALRTEFMPGDKITIKIVSAGSNPKQGVGYLPDGMMVVVDNAVDKIGQEVEVTFVRFVQTSAGRMMFAKLTTARGEKRSRNTRKRQ